jgi:hypothetical protein
LDQSILDESISVLIHAESHPIAGIEVSSGTGLHLSTVDQILGIQLICICSVSRLNAFQPISDCSFSSLFG